MTQQHRPIATIVGPSLPAGRVSYRHHVGYRKFIAASLALIVVTLFASAPIASAAPGKTCMEIKEDYDLRNAARDNNVFLIVHEPEKKETRESICKKLESTPSSRLSETSPVFAYLEIADGKEDYEGNWQEGNKNFVKTSLGLKNYPAFIYVTKGMDGFAKYSDHIKATYKGSVDDSLDLSDVEKFIEKHVGYKLGNDVYNIVFFDTLASRFVSYGDTEPYSADRIKQRLLSLLVRVSTLFSWKEPFSTIGKLYNRAFAMSFENGIDYCEKQVQKLTKRLESNKNNISEDKSIEFQQKVAILKSFSEPKELTAEDDKQIFIHSALHIGLIIATLLLFIVPADGDEKKEEEEEVVNAEPVVAKSVDEDEDENEDEKSTKKTK